MNLDGSFLWLILKIWYHRKVLLRGVLLRELLFIPIEVDNLVLGLPQLIT